MNERITFLILGDLHGEIPKIHNNEFDIIISPGDICGDYRDAIESEEIDFEESSLEKGRAVLEFLNTFNKPVILVPGNWDHTPYRDGMEKYTKDEVKNPFEKIKKGLKNIYDVEYNKVKIKEFTFIGYGSTSAPETIGFGKTGNLIKETENDRSKFFEERYNILNKLFQKEKNIVFISHNAPYNTSLDLINNVDSFADGEHYGSHIAKQILLNHKKFLSLFTCGHIHEGVGVEIINETHCINSGFKGDINVFVHLNKETKEIEDIEFLGENGIN